MRRLLLTLAAALWLAAPCYGSDDQQRVVVIERLGTPFFYSDIAGGTFDAHTNHERGNAMLSALLQRTGVKYDFGGWDSRAKTEFCRTGIFPIAFGDSTSPADTFGAVIHWNIFRGTSSLRNGAYRPDSLTLSAKTLLVPQLAMRTNFWNLIDINNHSITSTATYCSLGVDDWKANQAYGAGLHVPGSTDAFMVGTYVAGWVPNYQPAGGLRVLLSSNATAREMSMELPCIDCDSMWAGGTTDTAQAWELPKANLAGSEPFVFADVAGAGALYDTTGDFLAPCENDPLLMLFALARLDTLMGNTLFDSDALPIKVGVTIDGGFRHQDRNSFNGGFAPDSATIKINAARLSGIPAVLGVNVDSVNAYPYEKGWWKAWDGLRYTPQSWERVEDSTGVAGRDTAGVLHLEDVMGRLRKRVAYGPAYTSGADTSIYALLTYAKDRTAALFPGKTSTTLLAPLDDLLPANWGGKADSALYAIARAGFSTVRIHGRSVNGTRAWNAPNPLGLDDEQRIAYPFGERVKALAHIGYSQLGGAQHGTWLRWDDAAETGFVKPTRDTTYSEVGPNGLRSFHIYDEMQRVVAGLLTGRDHDHDQIQYEYISNAMGYAGQTPTRKMAMDDYQRKYTERANIIRLCVNDFAGDPNGPPASNGYWLLKNLKTAFDAINATAGRTVIMFAYPEDIDASR